jgi:hypothetical protein
MSVSLTSSQQIFAERLAKSTGLSPKVTAAWVVAEEGGANSAAAQQRERSGNHNWLNIGPGRSYSTPQQGADAAAKLLNSSGYYKGIRAAARTGDPSQQIQAIADSPWDAGHYRGGGVLRQLAGEVKTKASASTTPTPVATQPVVATKASAPSVDMNSALVDSLLSGKHGAAMLQGAIQGIASGKYDTTTQSPIAATGANSGANGAKGAVGPIARAAQKVNDAKVPYQWGGGHGARQDPNAGVTPLDCSGAVSRVLGINPRVASQFKAWGSPGRGKSVTIYAKDDHVLMEINGHFWGTSRANPGGGAGWIPRSAISPAYLGQFTARHPAGQ